MRWLAELPTTNLRIVVSLVLAVATGVRVVGWSWEPPTEWLLFLASNLGLDIVQFTAKRITHHPAPPPEPER